MVCIIGMESIGILCSIIISHLTMSVKYIDMIIVFRRILTKERCFIVSCLVKVITLRGIVGLSIVILETTNTQLEYCSTN